MYKNILQKCLDELNKEPFKIDKVIGMLETLIEMDNSPSPYVPSYPMVQPQYNPLNPPYVVTSATSTGSGLVSELTEEEIMAQRYAGGTVGAI